LPNTGFVAIAAGYRHSVGLKRGCLCALVGDFNDDCDVNFDDFALMGMNWLVDCYIEPPVPACVPR
jgi:hypothetical protein